MTRAEFATNEYSQFYFNPSLTNFTLHSMDFDFNESYKSSIIYITILLLKFTIYNFHLIQFFNLELYK